MSTLTILTPGQQATVETAAMIGQSLSRLVTYATADERATVLATILDADERETWEGIDTPTLALPHLSAYYGVPSINLRENHGATFAVVGLRVVPRHVVEHGYALPYPVEVAHHPAAYRAVAVAEVACRCGCPGSHLLITDSGLRVLGLDWQAAAFPRFWPELHNVGCDGGYDIDPTDI